MSISSALIRLESGIHGLRSQTTDLQTDLQQIRLAHGRNSGIRQNSVHNLHQRIEDVQTLQQRIPPLQNESLIEQDATVQEPITRLLAGQQRIEVKLGSIEATSIARVAEACTSIKPSIPIGNLPACITSTTAVRISTYASRYLCRDSCICSCHRRQTQRTPQLLKKALGTLFFGYVGIPYLTPKCDIEECTQRSDPMVLVTYLFPTWLLARALVVTSKLSSINLLEFSLRVPRIVSPTANIWDFCSNGNIEGMKILFQQGLGSP